jgi:hypothetical protein
MKLVLIRATRRHLPEDDNHLNWRLIAELEKNLKEEVVAESQYNPNLCVEGLIDGVPVDIRKQHFPTATLVRYRYSNVIGG